MSPTNQYTTIAMITSVLQISVLVLYWETLTNLEMVQWLNTIQIVCAIVARNPDM